RRNQRRRKAAHRRLQIGHHQGGWHSLSCHIRDAQPELVVTESEYVVIVSANHAGGLPGAGDLVTGQLWNFFWKEALLDGARFGDFMLLLMELRGDFFLSLALLNGTQSQFAALAA